MPLDYNDTGPQRDFEVIPADTVAAVRMTVRPGNAGEGGWLRRSKDGNSEQLDIEFTVTDGEYAKRKFWTLLTIGGTTPGHAEAADISARTIRAMLESSRGVKRADTSETARAARRIQTYGELNGLSFIARIGVEPARNGFKAKNRLDHVITPDETAWHPVQQEAKPAAAAPSAKPASAPAKIARPSWGHR
jgi:hypothetical protein